LRGRGMLVVQVVDHLPIVPASQVPTCSRRDRWTEEQVLHHITNIQLDWNRLVMILLKIPQG